MVAWSGNEDPRYFRPLALYSSSRIGTSLPQTIMTTTSHRPMDAYRHYPEKNPYDIRPPVYTLVPYPDVDNVDTPQLKQVARDVANRTGINVLNGMCGQCPLLMAELGGLEVYENPVPFAGYRRPPPLSKTSLPDDVAFVQQVNVGGSTSIFVVRTGGLLRLLKIVRCPVYLSQTRLMISAYSTRRSILTKARGNTILSTRTSR